MFILFFVGDNLFLLQTPHLLAFQKQKTVWINSTRSWSQKSGSNRCRNYILRKLDLQVKNLIKKRKISSCSTVIEQVSIVVETHNRMDYNILPYRHLAAKRMVIQHFLTSGAIIQAVMRMAKNTVLLNLNLFSRNSKKPYSSLK